jgi:outer membrane protein insertion porin family
MTHLPGLRFLLAAQVLCASLPAGEPGAGSDVLRKVAIQGGSVDDAAFAQVAAALPEGVALSEPAFQVALEAIRATDRFRAVTGRLVPGPEGLTAELHLDPWPVLARLKLEGMTKGEVRDLRVGDRVGARRLEAWRGQLQVHLTETGYPQAQVRCERAQSDQVIRVLVQRGTPSLITRVEVAGAFRPYTAAKLIKIAKIVPGKTLWTPVFRLESLARLRKKFLSDQRFESQVDLVWEPGGLLRLTADAGPVVKLKAEGDGLGWRVSLKDMVPLARANRYSPEILDEGERRIVRVLRGKGYLDAQVGHRRDVKRTSLAGDEEVLVTYTIHRGERSPIRDVRFERNKAISEAELKKAAALPSSIFSPGGPLATPDLVDGVEARVKALYLSRGYTEATVRLQPLTHKDGKAELLFRVYEGPQRMVSWLKLELPPGGFGDPWGLGECLSLLFAERPLRVQDRKARRYRSELPGQAGVEGTLTSQEDVAHGGALTLTLTLNKPIPLLKSDLARVFNAVRQQRLSALGVLRPLVRLTLEDVEGGGTGVRLEVPEQAVDQVERLVVQGADRTRAKAVLRETQLKPGSPLDMDTLTRAQARLSYLGAFQRVDLTSLGEPQDSHPGAGQDGPPVPWKQGDLLLRLEERPPWLVTSGFGYDRSQGYHFGLGVQRLNVGGMGRTVDLGIRAGNDTINSKTLQNMFPTGTYNRSVDSFTLGYTDPWFAPGGIMGWLPDRTQFSTEAAYIQERRAVYLLRRRRYLASLQWLITPQVSFQVGYRFERVEVSATSDLINSHELAILARYPERAIISAPYAQVARDTRDNPFDPTRGSYSVARLELANQLFLTSPNSSFVKLDLRQQWTWPLGDKASWGVVALGMRVGMAKPTAATAKDLPLSERFFAGGPFTQRGVEPDGLGPLTKITALDANGKPSLQTTPLGGQGLALVNLEYRFPILGKGVWGEVFVDSGQVYESLKRQEVPVGGAAQFAPFRTSVGLGLIFKVSIPIKLEYAVDVNRLLGRPRSENEVETQLKGLLFSAGFQF